MLNESQKLTIKVAVKRARENGTESEEIKKLSAGMGVPESEIRAEADKVLGVSSFPQSASNAQPDAAKHQAPATPPELPKQHRNRIFWTDRMMQQLTDLRNSGKGIAEIAKTMGLDSQQVQSKLSRMPLSENSTAVSPKSPVPPAIPTPPPAATTPQTVTYKVSALVPSDGDVHDLVSRTRADAAHLTDGVPLQVIPDLPSVNYLDMPDLLSGALDWISDHLGVKASTVSASNNEHRLSCTFVSGGVTYLFKLEVLK